MNKDTDRQLQKPQRSCRSYYTSVRTIHIWCTELQCLCHKSVQSQKTDSRANVCKDPGSHQLTKNFAYSGTLTSCEPKVWCLNLLVKRGNEFTTRLPSGRASSHTGDFVTLIVHHDFIRKTKESKTIRGALICKTRNFKTKLSEWHHELKSQWEDY